MSSRQEDRRENTLAEHAAIAKSLAERNRRATSREMQRHLESTIRNLRHIAVSDEKT